MNITTRAHFGKLAELHKKTGLGAEIGVQYGTFSTQIAEHYTGKIACIDLWGDEAIYHAAQKNLSDTNKFKLFRADSLTLAQFIPDESLDFVYIDANHHYFEVRADIDAWLPKVRKGGIIAGHDYCIYDDIEVVRAVNDWCKDSGYTIQLTTEDFWDGHPFPTWWTIKK